MKFRVLMIAALSIATFVVVSPSMAEPEVEQTVAAPEPAAGGFNADRVAEQLESLLGGADDRTKDYRRALKKLEEATQTFTPEDAEELMKTLESQELTIDTAEKVYDKKIADIKKTQELGDPEGAFAMFMDEMEIKAMAEARDAQRDGDEEFSDDFEKMAKVFVEVRARAIKARTDAIPAIQFLEENKRKVVRSIKLKAFARIAVLARETVEKLEQQSQEVQDAATLLQGAVEATPR